METITIKGFVTVTGWRRTEKVIFDYFYILSNEDSKIYKIKYDKRKHIPVELNAFLEVTGISKNNDDIINNVVDIKSCIPE